MNALELGLMNHVEASDVNEQIKMHLKTAARLLKAMHDKKGYRVLGYKNWVDYLRTELDKGKSWFYNQLRIADIVDELNAMLPKTSTALDTFSDSVLLELAKVNTQTRGIILNTALLASNGKPTAATIRHAADEHYELAVTRTYTDADGNQISAAELVAGATAGRILEASARGAQRIADSSTRKRVGSGSVDGQHLLNIGVDFDSLEYDKIYQIVIYEQLDEKELELS